MIPDRAQIRPALRLVRGSQADQLLRDTEKQFRAAEARRSAVDVEASDEPPPKEFRANERAWAAAYVAGVICGGVFGGVLVYLIMLASGGCS